MAPRARPVAADSRGAVAGADAASWQAQKSAATRRLIVEAVLAVLADGGSVATTTHRVAERAGLSRGALLHHYPAKRELLLAAADHLNALRLAALEDSLRDDAADATERVLVDAFWAHLTQPLAMVGRELALAAREDATLRARLEQGDAACAARWDEAAASRLTEPTSLPIPLVRLALAGLALAGGAEPEPERRRCELAQRLRPPASPR